METMLFTLLIAVWGITNAALALISVNKIKRNQKECNFIWWWAFPSGAFVWEDMLVFGVLHAGLALISLVLGSNTFWLVSFLVFWVVRSAGETLYYFLQQFIVPKHHPHNVDAYLGPLRKLFGNIFDQKSFILMQVLCQTVLVISILGLIYTLSYSQL